MGMETNLTQSQIDQLDSWGFKWESDYKPAASRRPTQSWDESFADLVKYKELHGNVMVPRNDKMLGGWVHGQRCGYTKFLAGEKSHLSTQKIKKLTDIGFAFRTSGTAKRKGNEGGSEDDSSKRRLVTPKQEPGIQEQNTHLWHSDQLDVHNTDHSLDQIPMQVMMSNQIPVQISFPAPEMPVPLQSMQIPSHMPMDLSLDPAHLSVQVPLHASYQVQVQGQSLEQIGQVQEITSIRHV
jgi:Helicase associated domain